MPACCYERAFRLRVLPANCVRPASVSCNIAIKKKSTKWCWSGQRFCGASSPIRQLSHPQRPGFVSDGSAFRRNSCWPGRFISGRSPRNPWDRGAHRRIDTRRASAPLGGRRSGGLRCHWPRLPRFSKQAPDPVVGIDGVRAARAVTTKPLVAIGGIDRSNCAAVIQAGADSVAVISDLIPRSGNSAVKRVKEFFLRLGDLPQ